MEYHDHHPPFADDPAPSLEKATPDKEVPVDDEYMAKFGGAPNESWSDTQIDNHGVAWVLRSEAEVRIAEALLHPETWGKTSVATAGGEDWVREAARIYVASSWRNDFQPKVIAALREDGHEVYDFRNPPHGKGGFNWSQIGKEWQQWTPQEYLAALQHPLAEEGFKSDMDALRWCNVCVFVMPCGPSASMEMGWASGSGRKVIAYIPIMREPDLMVKMADHITDDLNEVRAIIRKHHTGGQKG